MHLSRFQFVLLLSCISIHTTIYAQINGSQNVTAPSASDFAYPQSIFVDSPNGHIWITDFSNHRVLRFDVSTLTSIERSVETNTPRKYSLAQNYPNPFNPTTQISFSIRNSAHVTLTVYNLLGQEVAMLFNEMASSNSVYSITFDAKNLPSGIYLYSLRTSNGIEIRKMCLLK